MYSKSQTEISKNWKGETPLVSICCITYNHEKYIGDALNSFLMQETNFPFEIVIHDDASPDSTQEIIKRYEEKYPNIFKPIYQTENQKSKFKSGMNPRFNYPRAKGKYIAMCEGDDYWTDPLKLQKQVDFLEENERYSICIHNAYKKDVSYKGVQLFNKEKIKKTLGTKDVILKSWFTPTASFLFRKFDMNNVNWDGVNGDIFILFLCSLRGDIYYMSEPMSVYRLNVLGSATLTSSKKILYQKKFRFLNKVDKKTNRKFLVYTTYIRLKLTVSYFLRVLLS